MKPTTDPWGWRERAIAVLIVAAALFLLWQLVRAETAEAGGGGVSGCVNVTWRNVRVEAVNCYPLGVRCCAAVTLEYMGRRYPANLCAWRNIRHDALMTVTGRCCGGWPSRLRIQ